MVSLVAARIYLKRYEFGICNGDTPARMKLKADAPHCNLGYPSRGPAVNHRIIKAGWSCGCVSAIAARFVNRAGIVDSVFPKVARAANQMRVLSDPERGGAAVWFVMKLS